MRRIDWHRGLSGMRAGLALLHLGVALVTAVRPHITELVIGYARFDAIMPTRGWGLTAAIIGTGLLLIPRGRPSLILWQFASAVFFFLFAILVTIGPAGFNFGTMVYGGLAMQSLFLAYLTIDDWMWNTKWPQRVRSNLADGWGQRGKH